MITLKEIPQFFFKWELTQEGPSWATRVIIVLALRGYCAELCHPSVLCPSFHCVTFSCTMDWCWTLSVSPAPETLPLEWFYLVKLQPLRKSIYSGNQVSALVCLPTNPQYLLNNLLDDIKRTILEANKWIRSFWLDPHLILEVTPTV